MAGAAQESTERKAPGRKTQGQEEVIRLESLKTRIDDLVELHIKADKARDTLNDAIKATAEQTGLLATTVAKYVRARAGDKFDEAKTKALQLALVFEEVTPGE